MKILVIGASGLVGGSCLDTLREAGHDVVGTYFTHWLPGLVQLDVGDTAAVSELISKVDPAAVIYCAAWSWVDGCEGHPERANRENCERPAHCAQAVEKSGGRFIHFSTSYVFDGAEGPYTEEAEPHPTSVYGRTKLAGERAVLEATVGRAAIVRTMGVYGVEPQRKNFVYQVRDRLGKGERMRVPCDQFGNASFAPDLAAGVLRLLEEASSGIWNLAGPDPFLARSDFALRIAEAYALDASLFDFVPTADLNQPAPRPRRAGLIVGKAGRTLGWHPRSWGRLP